MKNRSVILFLLSLTSLVTLTFAQGKTLNIAVIIKATDSDFWQYMVVGSQNYAKEHPDVKITVDGPASEADVDKQVAILENIVSRNPDGILFYPTSSEPPFPALGAP